MLRSSKDTNHAPFLATAPKFLNRHGQYIEKGGHRHMTQQAKILYIEDNPDNRKLVYRLLTAYKFDIHVVADGQAGLEFIQTTQPDLILMDISMPKMDGFTVTKHIRKNNMLDNTPIIALTANVMKGDREKTLEAGCDGYIQKPINIDTFPDQIRSFLQIKPNTKAL